MEFSMVTVAASQGRKTYALQIYRPVNCVLLIVVLIIKIAYGSSTPFFCRPFLYCFSGHAPVLVA